MRKISIAAAEFISIENQEKKENEGCVVDGSKGKDQIIRN